MDRINVLSLNRYLLGNTDAVMTLLESLDIPNLSLHGTSGTIRFSRERDSNPSSCAVFLDTLAYYCFSSHDHGDIYTLIMDKKKLNFPQALQFAASALHLDESRFNETVRVPFGGFYKSLKPGREVSDPLTTYPPSALDPFKGRYSLLFQRDGIGFDTQALFQVGYDIETMRVTIPIWTVQGELCGVMGRLNDPHCHKEDRWHPIIPCSRSKTVYGFHLNYYSIKRKGLAIIGESEKFVMQLHSMGSAIGLSTCGCIISKAQAKYLKSLMVPKLILAFDEGLSEGFLIEQAEKLKSRNSLYGNQVGYIFDKQHSILPEGSKASPSDLGWRAFADLVQNHVRWI